MLFYDKMKTPSHQGERCAVINTAGGTCSCCRPIYPLLQPPATSTPAKLPCTNGLPQLAGSCIKENQDLISEILEKLFVFSSVYLTGSGSVLSSPSPLCKKKPGSIYPIFRCQMSHRSPLSTGKKPQAQASQMVAQHRLRRSVWCASVGFSVKPGLYRIKWVDTRFSFSGRP